MATTLQVSSSFRCLFQKSRSCIFPQIFSPLRFYNVTRTDKLVRRNEVTKMGIMYNAHTFVRWKHSTRSERREKMKSEKPELIIDKVYEDIPVIVDMLTNNGNLNKHDIDKPSPQVPESSMSPTENSEKNPLGKTQQLLEAYINTDISTKHLEELMSKIRVNIPTYADPRKKLHPDVSSGLPDPSVPKSDIDCPGCGALLHCQDQNIPGYIPSKKFLSLDRDKLLDTLCFRCFLMKFHKYCLNIKVSIDEYPNILSKIKTSTSLVLVVVDMSDMNNSILKTLLPAIGKTRPIFVIGNKIDTIPMDSNDYLERLKKSLVDACIEAGWNLHGNIRHVALVSAKTGYGIERLVSKMFNDWNRYGDIYLIGCANVGKSSIFNILLQSDLCQSHVRDLYERATVSVWPGTTINLLKFPILRATPERMYKRKLRLQEEKEIFEMMQRKQRQNLDKYGLSKNAVLMDFVGQTLFKDTEQSVEGHHDVSYSTAADDSVIEKATTKKKILKRKELLRLAPNLASSCWLYDTPGVVNPQQIINLLEQEELEALTPKEMLRPRTVKIRPNQVMFITGLGCIEYIKGDMQLLFTVISRLENPIHIVNADESHSFLKENIGTDVLQIPLGDTERLGKLPPLVGKEFKLIGTGFKSTICDIVLSSLGWVGVSGKAGSEIVVRAFTPGGYGCHSRPSLLPKAVLLKKNPIKRSPFYVMKKPMSLVKSVK